MPMLCFWDFITKYDKFKREKVEEETQVCKKFEREIEFLPNKNEMRGRVKMDSSRC